MELLFWVALVGAVYSYFLYPVILSLLPGRPAAGSAEAAQRPFITLIVTVHNEAERIRQKLDNCLELRYPNERLEIVVASDASEDGTDAIVGEYADRGVRLVRAEQRKGKEYAQWLAIQAARGDLLVFSDASTRIGGGALLRIADDFADPQVGAVSSEDCFLSEEGRIVGEGMYVRYEMWLRRLESDVNSLVGLSGSFFAARKVICQQWDINSPSDFNTALNCVRYGYVAISDPDLLGYYPAIKDEAREYQRKLRTVLRGITSLVRQAGVLNPMRYGLFSFQIWSHKVLRWLVPWFLLALFVSSASLADMHWFYALALAGQIGFYSLVLAGLLSKGLRGRSLIKVPFFFIQVNIAIAHATLAFLMGKRITVWQPSKR